jgi:hypothetical protein|tara:strand:- start:680 stop:820 length:141 start_codon:yes stop_codon:yes gene_type:complete
MKQNKFTTKIYDIMADKEMNIVFLVLEFVDSDLKKVLNSVEEMQLN